MNILICKLVCAFTTINTIVDWIGLGRSMLLNFIIKANLIYTLSADVVCKFWYI